MGPSLTVSVSGVVCARERNAISARGRSNIKSFIFRIQIE